MNFNSHASLKYKISVINSLVDKVVSLSEKKHISKNLTSIKQIYKDDNLKTRL